MFFNMFTSIFILQGVFNILEGCDGEIDVKPNMTEEDIELP